MIDESTTEETVEEEVVEETPAEEGTEEAAQDEADSDSGDDSAAQFSSLAVILYDRQDKGIIMKIKKEKWWAITYIDSEGEEVVGFVRTLIFRYRKYAVKEYKDSGYGRRDKREKSPAGWRIKKVEIIIS